MSRLIIKNLPKSVTADKLRNIFSEKGVVTDVQLKYTKEGKFRHFGFVGYKTEEEAQRACEYFNNTCINATRIKVEVCLGLGDPNKPKAWSKYSSESTAYKKVNNADLAQSSEPLSVPKPSKPATDSKVKEATEKHKNDPLFMEFMETQAKGNKALWSNDNIISKTEDSDNSEVEGSDGDSGHESEGDSQDESSDKGGNNLANKEISDLEYLKLKTKKDNENEEPTSTTEVSDTKNKTAKKEPKPYIKFFTVKVRGLAYSSKKKDLKVLFHPLKPKSIRIPVKVKGIAYVCFKTEKEMKQALVKNKSFLAGKRIWVSPYTKQEDENSNSNANYKWKEQEEALQNEESIAESGRIFIRNLSYTVTEEEVEKLFNKYGPLTEVAMPVDRLSRKPKGFAIVTFVIPEHAVKAYTELDGSVFHGRMLHLLPGKSKKSIEELLQMEGLSFKQKKILKMKAEAASSHNWNSLFIGQNAVADIIADTYNTTKEKVLDSTGKGSVAVRLALGETQIISETRDFLLENDVHLDAFNQEPKARSKTVILAKNLPAKTYVNDIRKLFAKFGELGRVVLPPSGVTAIIEFLEPSEARSAFMKLAYTKFKHLPLYLEWAPSNTFSTETPVKTKTDRAANADGETGEQLGTTENGPESDAKKNDDNSTDEDDEPPEADTMLFIKGLNFDTREEAIKEHFKKCGPIHYISVALKKDPKNPGKSLSMGYGFIQFKHKASADKALKTLQQSVIEGYSIELKRSNRTIQSEVMTARKKANIGKQTGTKILVRNVPFQATKMEIADLFKVFGEIRALRMPRKMVGTGSHRGFAFVDYYTKHDAKRAFKALCQSTHLYGRRLLLEWATTEEDIDAIRKRTADAFLGEPASKNLRKSTFSLEGANIEADDT